MRSRKLAQAADGKHVLDQSAQIGMVDVLGGGRGAIHARQRFVVEEGFEQPAQMRIGDAGHQAAQLGEHFHRIARGGGEIIGEIDVRIQHARPSCGW